MRRAVSPAAVARRVVAATVLLATLAGCTDAAPDPRPDRPSSPPVTTTTPAVAPPAPRVGQCRSLGFRAATAPTSAAPPVRCGRPHTAETFFVGRLDLVEAGHRLAVDSPAVQAQPREACTRRLAGHLGATERALRTSMARAVWFTPTVEEAAAGASWFRCDVVVLASTRRLATLPRRTRGLGTDASIAMCSTGRPGDARSRRVRCDRPHSWRAIESVDLAGRAYPTVAIAARTLTPACRDAARGEAEDPLDFTWTEERPTREQWQAGQRYGICWVPD